MTIARMIVKRKTIILVMVTVFHLLTSMCCDDLGDSYKKLTIENVSEDRVMVTLTFMNDLDVDLFKTGNIGEFACIEPGESYQTYLEEDIALKRKTCVYFMRDVVPAPTTYDRVEIIDYEKVAGDSLTITFE